MKITTYLFYLLSVLVLVSGHNFSFPAASPWYQDVSAAALDPSSAAITSLLDSLGIWSSSPEFQVDFSFNIQYATAATPKYSFVQASGYYLPDCDAISNFPVAPGGMIEGEVAYNTPCGDDCHYLIVDQTNNKLYESYNTYIDTSAQTVRCSL